MFPDYEWDESKRLLNLEKHGIDFKDAIHFDWDSALVVEDTREAYFEERFQALGFMGNTLLVMMIFTPREDRIRVISIRRATSREKKRYEQEFH